MSSHSELEENISNLEFRINELENAPYFLEKEIAEKYISRLEEKISKLEGKLEVAEKQINSNKQQIGGLYNIQLYGKPY